ncbi:uncharacterized protein LOC124434388 [Xenia sp. Carnegie-2017]|uniref:uncharacterized protein LOC124434388 n=1 Tax=Xenia sp. Carnegie-2017 TaxID=2897299 RepID=UPI001F04CD00|nr:uncharacterized protein LOC124434388 [Xenia sp. Carnegie-2017]
MMYSKKSGLSLLILSWLYVVLEVSSMPLRELLRLDSTRIQSEGRKCHSLQDCPVGYCCTGLLKAANEPNLQNVTGTCKMYKGIGERCSPKIFPGDYTCPCSRGLTCTTDLFSEEKGFFCETVGWYYASWGTFGERL